MNSDPVKEQEFMDHLTLFTADHPSVATPPPPPAVTVPSPPTNDTPHAYSLTEKFTAGVTLSKQSLGHAINAFLVQHTARPLDPHLVDSCTVDESGVARLLKTDDDGGEEEEGAVDLELLMRCYKHLGRIEILAKEKEGWAVVGDEGTVSPPPPPRTVRECGLSAEDRAVEGASPKTKDGAAAVVGGGAGGGLGGGLGKRKRQRQDEASAGPRTRSKVASS